MGDMAVMLNPVLMRSNSRAMPLAPTPMPLLMRSRSGGGEERQGCKGGVGWVGRGGVKGGGAGSGWGGGGARGSQVRRRYKAAGIQQGQREAARTCAECGERMFLLNRLRCLLVALAIFSTSSMIIASASAREKAGKEGQQRSPCHLLHVIHDNSICGWVGCVGGWGRKQEIKSAKKHRHMLAAPPTAQ